MVVGTLQLELRFYKPRSLKEKRMVIKSLKERLKHRFNISISEVDGQDTWQSATLAIAMVNNDKRFVESSFQKILSFIDGSGNLNICEQQITFN